MFKSSFFMVYFLNRLANALSWARFKVVTIQCECMSMMLTPQACARYESEANTWTHTPPCQEVIDSHQGDAIMSDSTMRPYIQLILSLVISYFSMLGLMLTRVNVWENLYLSLNQFYMSGVMVSVMALIMMGTMWKMFSHKKLNVGIILGSIVVGMLSLYLVRTQTGVNDERFLDSMIPHHAAAILVCENADLSDERVQKLCREIIKAQEEEIRIMKGMMGTTRP